MGITRELHRNWGWGLQGPIDLENGGKDLGQLCTKVSPCLLPPSYAAHRWEPSSQTTAFAPPTTAALSPALPRLPPHLVPGPDIQHRPSAHLKHARRHRRSSYFPGQALDLETPSLSAQAFPMDLLPPLLPTRHYVGPPPSVYPRRRPRGVPLLSRSQGEDTEALEK